MSNDFDEFIANVRKTAIAHAAGMDRALSSRGRQNKRKLQRLAPLELEVVELACVYLFYLSTDTVDRRNTGRPTIWSASLPNDAAFESALIFQACLDFLFNTLSIARRLICSGYNSQARTVFRQFVELFDATVVLVGDGDFFATFREHRRTQEGAFALWKRWFKPSELRKRRTVIEKNFTSDSDILDYFRDYGNRTYTWLSQASHVNPFAVMLESFPRKHGATIACESSLGGTVGPAAVGTLSAMAWYLCVSIGLLHKILVDQQKWLKNSPSEDDVRTAYVSSMITDQLHEIAIRGRRRVDSMAKPPNFMQEPT